eukprot:TRINITY_DN150_c0_g1_i2.p2 TRINITY_DN150_c0_g1~~TRINITY_DN150_c0_g1_i2.p2  ORF type:complete len:282 (+),score=86.36 TRINITY_DN150_c0_g1_i2:1083-1928(+)
MDIIGDLLYGAVGWTDWNLLLDMQGGPNHVENFCDSPILVDTSNQKVEVQPKYYYMGQISKFVVPGSIRVQTINFLNSKNIIPIDGQNYEGENVQLSYCGSEISSQKWSYNSFTKHIYLEETDLCLDDSKFNETNNPNVVVWKCSLLDSKNQKWYFISGNRLQNENSNLCLTIDDYIDQSGANVVQKPCDENDVRQKWRWSSNGSNQIQSFLPPLDNNSLCLQVGRLSLYTVSFVTPVGDNILIAQNTASYPVNFKFQDDNYPAYAANITLPNNSITTFIF